MGDIVWPVEERESHTLLRTYTLKTLGALDFRFEDALPVPLAFVDRCIASEVDQDACKPCVSRQTQKVAVFWWLPSIGRQFERP
ncbi:hypothetical protein PSEEN4579 [Pseudomonas entomophila L48]|uniref:Uncharacterized protein n=1 Tax=Pseudomonas entomophila (strain L48) TaxID=384676 RepID=Q1I526_PSEE4|nr:hypothetical protein PSEEN4579 [Pseudomonas entomophila L48]